MLISGNYPPDAGGPAKFAKTFSDWCQDHKFKVQVITYAKETLSKSLIKENEIKSIRISQPLPLKIIRMIFAIGLKAVGKSGVICVGSFVETYFASLIFNFRYVSKVPGDIVWERARNNNFTNLDIEEFQSERLNFKYSLFRKLFTKSLQRSQKVIVPSQGLYNLCILWGVPDDKLVLIYNSVASPFINFTKSKNAEFDLITVCRLTPWKGVKELIQYSSRYNRELVVAGDGPLREELQEIARILNAPVHFLGEISQAHLIDVLSKSKIFVLNSSYEGLPHSLIEARAMGVLSVARDQTGSAEVINDNFDGLLITKNRGLTETLNLAFKKYLESNYLQKNAFEDVQRRFNLDKNFTKILHITLKIQ